ncbi:pectinesterase family protein [Sphingobacterium faecium]|uniref:pectinesterase family protein n=1 Tax=Sphingobacterium faecium TaxID=34087 RepID=UPI003208D87D
MMSKSILFILLFTLQLIHVSYGQEYDYIVSKEGNGNFSTVQEAINATPDFRKKVTRILIRKGIYKEKIIIAGSKQLIQLIGEPNQKVVLTYDDFAQKKNSFGEEMGTSGSSSILIYGDGFYAQNITFENSSGPVGQAVAAWIAADKAIFQNCIFLGFQDTLYTYGKGARQFYLNCHIEGTVDFIFGSSTAWFEKCILLCKNSGYITAASTPIDVKNGYLFHECQIIGDRSTGKFYLGRPWRPHAKVIFINTTLPEFIDEGGWDNWRNIDNEKTAYFAEYGNKGSGSHMGKRVHWSHQLTNYEAAKYQINTYFDDWNPIDIIENP